MYYDLIPVHQTPTTALFLAFSLCVCVHECARADDIGLVLHDPTTLVCHKFTHRPIIGFDRFSASCYTICHPVWHARARADDIGFVLNDTLSSCIEAHPQHHSTCMALTAALHHSTCKPVCACVRESAGADVVGRRSAMPLVEPGKRQSPASETPAKDFPEFMNSAKIGQCHELMSTLVPGCGTSSIERFARLAGHNASDAAQIDRQDHKGLSCSSATPWNPTPLYTAVSSAKVRHYT
jgi:hypothetical protein